MPRRKLFHVWYCCTCSDGPLNLHYATNCFNSSCASYQRGAPHQRCLSCCVESSLVRIGPGEVNPRPQPQFGLSSDSTHQASSPREGISEVIGQPSLPHETEDSVYRRGAASAIDSGYGSKEAPVSTIVFREAVELGINDTASIAANKSFNLWQDKEDALIGAIARSLAKNIDIAIFNEVDTTELFNALPELLCGFALELSYSQKSHEATSLAAFTRRNKDRITAAVKTMLEFATVQDTPGAAETEGVGGASPVGSAVETLEPKISQWVMSQPEWLPSQSEWVLSQQDNEGPDDGWEAKQVEAPLQFPSSHPSEGIEEMDELDELDMAQVKNWVNSSPFNLLSVRASNRLRLDYTRAECLSNIRGAASSLLRGAGGDGILHSQTATVVIPWDPLKFVNEQGYESSLNSLCRALTITGQADACQLLTCKEYLCQVWPVTGEAVLDAIIEACEETHISNSLEKKTLPDGTELQISLVDSVLRVECVGVSWSILETLEVLVWVGAALRQSRQPEEVECVVPRIQDEMNFVFLEENYFDVWFDLEEISDPTIDARWSCWRKLFRNPVIAKGFPVPRRSDDTPGLEISVEAMAILVGAPKLTIFHQRAILKGFNAAVFPTDYGDDHVKWHLLVNDDGSRIRYSDPKFMFSVSSQSSMMWQDFEQRRHILGWTPEVSYNIGSPLADYNIGWSSPDSVGAGCALEKVVISGSSGFISLGAEFSLGRKDKSPYIKRGTGAYFDTLNSLLSSYVVFYDVSHQRAWLTNAVHTLLHLVRASLKHSSESEFASEYILRSLSELQEDRDRGSPKAAIRFLSNPSNLQILLFPNPDELKTEETRTTRAGPSAASPPEVSTAEIRTSTGVRLKDRIQQIIYVLEQTIDHQANVHSSAAPGVPLKLTPRETLEGYRFMDIAARTARALTPWTVNLTTYNGAGKSWVDFTRAIRAVTLFGEGFGELLSPLQDPVAQTAENNICPNWKCLPVGKDYLAVSTYDLARILKQEGSTAEYPLMKLAPGVFWQKPETVFERCACRDDKHIGTARFSLTGHQRSCDRVQALLPQSFITKKVQKEAVPNPVLVGGGAVVFGRSERFPLKWPNRGEPKKDKASTDPPTTDGSISPVPALIDGMTSLSLSNTVASSSSPASSTRMTNTATPPSSSAISTPPTDDAASVSTASTSTRRRQRWQRLWNIAKNLAGS